MLALGPEAQFLVTFVGLSCCIVVFRAGSRSFLVFCYIYTLNHAGLLCCWQNPPFWSFATFILQKLKGTPHSSLATLLWPGQVKHKETCSSAWVFEFEVVFWGAMTSQYLTCSKQQSELSQLEEKKALNNFTLYFVQGALLLVKCGPNSFSVRLSDDTLTILACCSNRTVWLFKL